MQKRERRLTVILLGCLALFSAAITAWVCLKEQPQNVATFETRFMDLDKLGFVADEGLALEAVPESMTLRWETGEGTERQAVSDAIPLDEGSSEATLTVYVSGKQNALARSRWGYQIWLEWTCISQTDGRVIDKERIELPMESDKERPRVCSVSVRAEKEEPCQVRASLIVTPLEEAMQAGYLTLEHWEVRAR